MQPRIIFNDAWESISLDCADDLMAFLDHRLQPTHPLRAFKLFPIAKCWKKHKFLIEEEDSSDAVWVLDTHRKRRIRGKTCYYFKGRSEKALPLLVSRATRARRRLKPGLQTLRALCQLASTNSSSRNQDP